MIALKFMQYPAENRSLFSPPSHNSHLDPQQAAELNMEMEKFAESALAGRTAVEGGVQWNDGA